MSKDEGEWKKEGRGDHGWHRAWRVSYTYRRSPSGRNDIRALRKQLKSIRDALGRQGGIDLLKKADPAVEELVSFFVSQAAVAFAVVVFVVVIVRVGGCNDGGEEGEEYRKEEEWAVHVSGLSKGVTIGVLGYGKNSMTVRQTKGKRQDLIDGEGISVSVAGGLDSAS